MMKKLEVTEITMDRTCKSQGIFKKNRQYKEIAVYNSKEIGKIFETHNKESRLGEFNSHKAH